jgi:probable rRNA maturation factor
VKVEVALSPSLTPEQRFLVQRAGLQPLLEQAGDELGVGADSTLAVRCTDDKELAGLNLKFAKVAHATDVLSFPGEDDHVGDVAISIERAVSHAAGDIAEEIRLLAVHGLLHCLGYDHADKDGAARMSAATHKLLPEQAVPELEVPK